VVGNGRVDAGPGVIESAFGLLEILQALGRARLTDLTEESDLPRTTVYRLMGQLAAVGAVERIGAHYRLGPGLLAFGQHVTPMERLREVAQRPLIELAAMTPAHVGLATTTSRSPIYLEVLRGRDRLPFGREPGEPVPARSAGERVLTSGVAMAIDDSDSIDGVSCAAVAIPLPGGDAAAVGVVVPLPRLPRGLLAPLRTTANHIATLLAAHTPGSAPRSR
jgi:DNA-binding IclR family transcriptional regulator